MAMFKKDDGTVDRIATCVDIVLKFSLLGAGLVAVWQFYLFQQSTQIISTSIQFKPLTSDDKTYADITLAVTNTGKVRVNLVAGMLRIKAIESNDKLSFRLKGSDPFANELVIPNVFIVDTTKATYPKGTSSGQPDYLQSGTLFFDPGETIKMRFLIEYKGAGVCNLITSVVRHK